MGSGLLPRPRVRSAHWLTQGWTALPGDGWRPGSSEAAKEKRSGAGVNPKLQPSLPAAALARARGGGLGAERVAGGGCALRTRCVTRYFTFHVEHCRNRITLRMLRVTKFSFQSHKTTPPPGASSRPRRWPEPVGR
jgi:hypothetical protein